MSAPWDISTGFESYYTPMRFEGFDVMSPADTTMNMSRPISPEQRAHTPPDIFTDESMSPRDDTSSMLDINTSLDDPFSFYDRTMLNSAFQVAPVLGLDCLDDNAKDIPSHNDLFARRTSFNPRPLTRSGQNISHLFDPLADEMLDRSGSSTPTPSSSQYEGRDHEYYRRKMDPVDGLYHCPMEADGTCDFPPKALKCEYHKHIDSHLKPFRCRKPGCENQAFSSVACRLRHEREMHKMHNAEEFLCRYGGPCERKQSGNGFARSFNRGDHEKQVHHMVQENPRKGRPKSDTSNAHSTLRMNSDWRKRKRRCSNNASSESSTFTIGATVPPTSSEPSSAQASKKRLDQWAEHVHRLRDLTSRLPDVPDESSINILRPIDQEARELRAIHSDIDFRPTENPTKSKVKHVHWLDDRALVRPPTSLVSPTSNLFGSSTSVPTGYQFERFSANVDVSRIAGPVNDSSGSTDNAVTFESCSAEKTCTVCAMSKPPTEFKSRIFSACSHTSVNVCTTCLLTWLDNCLESRGWDKITCPECNVTLSHADMRTVASEVQYERYNYLSIRAAVSTIPNFRWCLNHTCTSGQIHESGGPIFVCVNCGTKHCVVHERLWHEGETCWEYDRRTGKKDRDEEMSARTIAETTKMCPRVGCGVPIEKSGGCFHMTCERCKHEFCWECLAPYDQIRTYGNTRHNKSCKYY